MKKAFVLILILSVAISLAACRKTGNNDILNTETSPTESTLPEAEKMHISVFDDIGGLALTKMKADRDYSYKFDYDKNIDTVIEKIKNGKTDFASLPVDEAQNLVSEYNNIRIIAITLIDNFFLISSDENFSSLRSIANYNNVAVGGANENTKSIFKYILAENGIEISDGMFSFSDNPEVVVNKANKSEISACILPEPYCAQVIFGNKDFKIITDFNAEYKKITGYDRPACCVVTSNDLADKNPDKVEEFLEFAQLSVNFIAKGTSNIKFLLTNKYFEDFTFCEYIVKSAGFSFITGNDMEKMCNTYFETVNLNLPDTDKLQIPGKEFYYQ
ncbi:MAG: hypothetical protein K6B52_03975 [Clostridiales bacterium]|nr:hypothetical protein [Clostridiales bacterium]